MAITPTYPGVYIQEVSSGVRTITGVATSITAFLGYFRRGPMNKAEQVLSITDFERIYGGLHMQSEAGYGIQQFFLNGGGEAWVVRVAKGAQAASIRLKNVGGNAILTVTAASEGAWGNNIRLDVDYATTEPARTFNLTVIEMGNVGGKQLPVQVETFRNLVIDASDKSDVVKIVNDGSKLIRLTLEPGTPSGSRPVPTGTTADGITDGIVSGLLPADTMAVTLNTTVLNSSVALDAPLQTVRELAIALQAKLRKENGLEQATVAVVGSVNSTLFLQFRAGTANPSDILHFSGSLATKLKIVAALENVQQYDLGTTVQAGAEAFPGAVAQSGSDGALPGGDELEGHRGSKTGLYALENVDLFNILCIPDTMLLDDGVAHDVVEKAKTYCEERRAFYIVDIPQPDTNPRDEPTEVREWLDQHDTLRHKNTSVYYPRPQIADPLNDYRLRSVAPSGTIAGVYARTDVNRGVWKAPAGTDAQLRGVQKLEYVLTDPENGTLNPLAINSLRTFPVYGIVSWGARTLDGSDQQASEWKYVPVRRLALFLEESLYRGTKWVVFEPNDEPLWSQIRLNVGVFMHNLFRQGAFQGKTPNEAYLVKCDKETTTQSDIDLGIVNIVVGFAPLKPAEFVIIKIQQLAGQLQT